MAASSYFETVQKLYIAYYQRPADSAGMLYWAQRIDAAGGDLSAVINAFATSEESQALYGALNSATIGNFVDAVYQALFNRAPDTAGKAFYVEGFNSGRFTAGNIALDILNGARNTDLTAIQNKVTMAHRFTQAVDGRDLTDPRFGTGTTFALTYAGNADAQAARAWLTTVTSDATTVKPQFEVDADVDQILADPSDNNNISTASVSIVFDDPNSFIKNKDDISNTIKAAFAYLEKFIVFRGTLDVLVVVDQTETGRFAGGANLVIYEDEAWGNYKLLTSSYQLESKTGIDPTPDLPDAYIYIDPYSTYFENLWWDPEINLHLDANPPNDKTDAYSVILHELLHGLGVIGWRDRESGALFYEYASLWDRFVSMDSGKAYWTGPSVTQLLNGTNLEIRLGGTQGIYHIGHGPNIENSQQPWTEPSNLNGYYFYFGERYSLGRLEIALLDDIGWETKPSSFTDVTNRWDDQPTPLYLVGHETNEDLVGDLLNDRIMGREGNDLIISLSGNDILYGEEGNDIIRGGTGDDYIDGGDGYDVAEFEGLVDGYKIYLNSNDSIITIQSSSEGVDTLINIESIKFVNKIINTTELVGTTHIATSDLFIGNI